MRIPSLLSLLYLLIAAPSHVSTSLNASALGAEYKDVEWDDDSWSITNHNLKQADFRHRMSLSNGYLGINLAATGPFFDVDSEANGAPLNDWPLFNRRQTFATIAGFYGYRESMILPNRTNFLWLEQYGGESLISGIPHWAGLYVEADGEILNATTDPSHIHSFSTTLNITAAEMSWNYTWTPAGGDPIHVQYAMFVHKLYVNQAAVQLKLTASRDTTVKVHDVLEGDCAVRSEFAGKMFELDMPTIWSAVRPANITNVTAYVFSTVKSSQGVDLANRAELQPGVSSLGGNSSSIGQSFELNLKAGETVHVEKFIGAASTDAFHDPRAVARNASFSGAATGYDDLLSSHIKEWSTILTKDSVDSYHLANGSLPQDSNIQFLHITSVTNPFYILQNTVGPNALYEANSTGLGTHSIPVCGLGSDCYAGFIMWDADAFIAPGLQVSHPYAMQQVTRYRLEKFEQAKRNVGMAFASSQNQSKFTPGGAVYPWTSGRQGNCTGTGPCFDYEYHLNGDIAIAMHNELVVTGDDEYFKENLFPVTSAIAHFYSQLLDDRGSSGNATNGTEGRWVLRNATDPDEYVNNVDGPAFTTALIRKHLNDTNWLRERFGLPRNGTWDERVKGIHLPVDFKTGIILEYEKMNASKEIKQADVVLIDDFLHWHHPGSLKSLDYYAARQSEFGPGMTYSAFSIVANKLSPSGCSSVSKSSDLTAPWTDTSTALSQSTENHMSGLLYIYDLYNSLPYSRPPWFQFSEQLIDEITMNARTYPGFPFLTGMGGAHRVAIYGYLGLHLMMTSLDVDPSLPPQIPRIDYRTFYWQGHAINATSNSTHTILERMPSEMALAGANSTFFSSPIPVTMSYRNETEPRWLDFGSPVVLTNRMIGQNTTDGGNILQCRSSVWSNRPFTPGQFPEAAVDGAASTKWQPANASQPSYLTVYLGETYVPIGAVHFDWGSRPPKHYEVILTNLSITPPFHGVDKRLFRNITGDVPVPSDPWHFHEADYIEPYKGNTTNYTLPEPVWTGRYAHLGIVGCEWHEYSTATVAEFALIRWNGTEAVEGTEFVTEEPGLATKEAKSTKQSEIIHEPYQGPQYKDDEETGKTDVESKIGTFRKWQHAAVQVLFNEPLCDADAEDDMDWALD